MSSPADAPVNAVHLLAAINRLTLKVMSVNNMDALIFTMLNDTIQILPYSQAVLWKINKNKIDLVGVSGQVGVNPKAIISKKWGKVIEEMPDKGVAHVIPKAIIEKERPEIPYLKGIESASILWLPIFVKGELKAGLWLERWTGKQWMDDEIELLKFLMKSYGAAWDKFSYNFDVKKILTKPAVLGALAVLFFSLFIRVPLRVVAPCEVVPNDPYIITAPLLGVIKEIAVNGGQQVKKGDLLFQYDKKVPLQDLQIAEKNVTIAEAELSTAMSQAFKDKKALSETATLENKLRKEMIALELAKYNASFLDFRSPVEGIVLIDNPDEWRGNPVKIGEKIMTIAKTDQVKVKIWVPEADNIALDKNQPIKVFLNVDPNKSYLARLLRISTSTTMSEKQVSSFIAEAEFKEFDPEIKLGLKGSAILYGENVSLFYWIIRKPWSATRNYLGI